MRNILLICLLLTFGRSVANDVDDIKEYARNVINFNREYPQEKVYLHMDNRSYFIGDTIWFKAYVMNATTLRPTDTSGVLYVELLNEKGVEMEHKKLRIVDGMCHGEFSLKEDYRTGYYEIRAYTRNMLNFGNEVSLDCNSLYEESFSFDQEPVTKKSKLDVVGRNESDGDPEETFKSLTVKLAKKDKSSQGLITDYNHTLFSRVFPVYMHPEKPGVYKEEMDFYPMHTKLSFPKETEIDIRPDNLQLSFFPEGGALVEGIPSIVAFEVVDQWGRKRDIKGYITEEKDNRIIDFKTFARGRGTFSLCPEVGKRYYAHVSYKDKDYRFELPQAENTGYVLRLSPPIANGAAMFSVLAAPNAPRELLGWTLQCRGALTAFDTLTVDTDGNSAVGIPSERLQPGVNQLTLYNARGEILADRLFFVSPMVKPATLTLQHLPECVEPFQEITLDMSVSDNSYRHTSHSYFSLSVTDADERTATYDTRDIRSELLLASDLKGFIEDVDSYFQHKSSRAMAADIDLLMLVQGWRRYEWCTMVDTTFTPRYTPEKGLQIDGYVISDLVSSDDSYLDANSYPRIPNLKMKVQLQNPMVQFTDSCQVDSLGRFHLSFKHQFHEEAMMTILMAMEEDDKKWYHRIIKSPIKFSYPVIYRSFSPLAQPYAYYQWNTPEQDSTRMIEEQMDIAMEGHIDDVIVKKRFKQKSEIYYENPDMVIDYYKEWNNVIDRGVPLLNYHKIIHEKDYRYLYDDDPHRKIESEKRYARYPNYLDNTDNRVLFNYSLGGRMFMHVNYEQAMLYDPIYNRYKEHRNKPYFMPYKILVYSNLIHREREMREKETETGHRPNVHFVIEYNSKGASPQRAPYMPKEGRRDTYFEGYSRVSSFYSPDYSERSTPKKKDYRRTLLWVPNIETGFDGKAKVTFYNNARTKHIHVRAEGFTRNGEFIVYDSEKE